MQDLWDMLHDGDLIAIQGDVPGDVDLTVEIGYITDLITPKENNLIVSLLGCDYFVYCPYDSPTIQSLSEVVKAELSIMGTSNDEKLGEPEYGITRGPGEERVIFVCCTSQVSGALNGVLKMRYSDFRLQLTDNTPVSLENFIEKIEAYWEGFGQK
jgi:hypothetical protein